MLTNKDYCDYDICVALKELGYPLTSKEVRYEDKAVFVPGVLLYSAQKFLREEKNIIVRIIPLYEEGKAIKGMSYTNEVIHWDDGYVAEECIEEYDSYEEALLEGLRKAVKILKENETVHG